MHSDGFKVDPDKTDYYIASMSITERQADTHSHQQTIYLEVTNPG